MFAEHIGNSNIIELVEEEVDEEAGAYRATLRVKAGMQKQWVSLLKEILVSASMEETSYGLEPHKAYFLEGDQMKFFWVLLIWGDLEAAIEDLKDLLSKRHEPPEPKSPDPRMRPSAARRSRRQVRSVSDFDGEGSVIITRVPVPHTRRDSRRYTKNPNQKVTLQSAGGEFKATAMTRGEAEFAPTAEKEREI